MSSPLSDEMTIAILDECRAKLVTGGRQLAAQQIQDIIDEIADSMELDG